MRRHLPWIGLLLICALAPIFKSNRPSNAPVASSTNTVSTLSRTEGDSTVHFSRRGDSSAFETTGQRLSRLFDGDGEGYKLTQDELYNYIVANGSNAFSLVAAYENSRNQDFIKAAAKLHPDDPLVQSKIVLHNVFPEERQKWIDALKTSSPNNSLGNFMAARELAEKGDFAGAAAELKAAQGKQFNDFYKETATGLQEAFLESGLPSIDAKVMGSAEVLLPHLAQLKKLSIDLTDSALVYGQSGQVESQRLLLESAYMLGNQLKSSGEGGVLITEMVGIAIENKLLANWPSSEPAPFLKVSPAEQIEANRDRRRDIGEQSQLHNAWFKTAPDP
jgi:hypothetical protein